MKKYLILSLAIFSILGANAQTKKKSTTTKKTQTKNYTSKSINSSNTTTSNTYNGYNLDITDSESISKFMMGKTWACSDAGEYTLKFTYDYCSKFNTYALIFWTQDKNNPWNYINVNFEPGYDYARVSGMNPDNGVDVIIYLYPNGHCESPTGNYFELLN